MSILLDDILASEELITIWELRPFREFPDSTITDPDTPSADDPVRN